MIGSCVSSTEKQIFYMLGYFSIANFNNRREKSSQFNVRRITVLLKTEPCLPSNFIFIQEYRFLYRIMSVLVVIINASLETYTCYHIIATLVYYHHQPRSCCCLYSNAGRHRRIIYGLIDSKPLRL